MTALIILFAIIPSSICFAVAAYVAIHGIAGWGWFLFVGLLVGGLSYKEGKGK